MMPNYYWLDHFQLDRFGQRLRPNNKIIFGRQHIQIGMTTYDYCLNSATIFCQINLSR